MSNFPPPPPPQEQYDPSLQYANPPSKLSGMALTSMILGIVGIPLMCVFGIGLLLGITAMILGIVSIININKRPEQFSGKGFAIAGIVLGGVSLLTLPLLVAIMLPSLGKARELSNRSVCAANLRGTAQSMNVYAADNNEAYPIVSRRGGYALAAGGSGTPRATPEDTLASMYATPVPSVTQNMWILVLTGAVAPKQFQCKSDPAAMAKVSATAGAAYFTNFNDGAGPSDLAYSYSFAYPWVQSGAGPGGPEIGGWWRNFTDASLPLIADMAPIQGTGSPAATPSDPTSRNSNSQTHQRDGQNVGFGDAHAEFTRMPAIGQSNDNIYTGNRGMPSATGIQTVGVVPPIGNGGAPSAWDIYMVPAADSASHVRR